MPLSGFDVPSLPARDVSRFEEDDEGEEEQPDAQPVQAHFGAVRGESDRDQETDQEPEQEGAAAEPAPSSAQPARRGRRSAAVSSITVDVTIPRGYGRRISAKLVRQVVEKAIEKEGLQQPVSVDVVMVTDDEMREINATRRGIDEATDVLSFPLLDLKPGQGITQDFFPLPPDVSQHLGDVVISVPRVESQAEEAGHSRERELAFLTVHGILHILGYDHDTDDRRRQMRRREEEILGELGLRRNGNQ